MPYVRCSAYTAYTPPRGRVRLSKNLAEDVRDRAAGGVCGGQKAHRAFNQQAFETFLNVSKAAQRGENTFSTRWLAGIAGALMLPYGVCCFPRRRSYRIDPMFSMTHCINAGSENSFTKNASFCSYRAAATLGKSFSKSSWKVFLSLFLA